MNTHTINVVVANELTNSADLISALRETLVPVGSNDPVIYSIKDFVNLSPDVLVEYPELEDDYNEMIEKIDGVEYIAID